ncbi:hypothetical protein [Nocardia cyriacigeorgica]|nr:hypothetical protein [Nocardia cyriacigeorgica]
MVYYVAYQFIGQFGGLGTENVLHYLNPPVLRPDLAEAGQLR